MKLFLDMSYFVKSACFFIVFSLFGLGSCNRTVVVEGFPESFGGIGLELHIKHGVPTVVRTLANSPASFAGVLINDRILAVDQIPTKDRSLGDVVMQLRGEPDTQVVLLVERDGGQLTIAVRRTAMEKTEQSQQDYAPTP